MKSRSASSAPTGVYENVMLTFPLTSPEEDFGIRQKTREIESPYSESSARTWMFAGIALRQLD